MCSNKIPNSQIKAKTQLDSLADALELLSAEFGELEKESLKKDKTFVNLRKKMNCYGQNWETV